MELELVFSIILGTSGLLFVGYIMYMIITDKDEPSKKNPVKP